MQLLRLLFSYSKVACVNDRLIYNGDGIRDVAGNVMGMQGNQHDNNLVTGGATPPADLGDGGTECMMTAMATIIVATMMMVLMAITVTTMTPFRHTCLG